MQNFNLILTNLNFLKILSFTLVANDSSAGFVFCIQQLQLDCLSHTVTMVTAVLLHTYCFFLITVRLQNELRLKIGKLRYNSGIFLIFENI